MSKTITISKEDYAMLKVKSHKLEALEIGGVDNWEYYSESLSDYLESLGVEDFDELYGEYVSE